MSSLPALGIFLLLTMAAAATGAFFPPGGWYTTLTRPPLNPPAWVFGPVWSMLYLAMAVAAWRVWRTGPGRSLPLVFWGVQLGLNALWSALFFGAHRMGLALVEILLLWAAIAVTTLLFFRAQSGAGWLMVPYLLWVSFAAYLNAGYWYLNR